MTFEEALQHVEDLEGGKVTDTADPADPTPEDPTDVHTNLGVTQKVYDRYRRGHQLKTQSVEFIEPKEVRDIYRSGYWEPCHCDDLEDRIDFAVFQMAVNCGIKPTIKALQGAAGVTPDGYYGPISERAVMCADTEEMLEKFFDNQRQRYRDVVKRKPATKKYLQGWYNRVTRTAKIIDFPYIPEA